MRSFNGDAGSDLAGLASVTAKHEGWVRQFADKSEGIFTANITTDISDILSCPAKLVGINIYLRCFIAWTLPRVTPTADCGTEVTSTASGANLGLQVVVGGFVPQHLWECEILRISSR